MGTVSPKPLAKPCWKGKSLPLRPSVFGGGAAVVLKAFGTSEKGFAALEAGGDPSGAGGAGAAQPLSSLWVSSKEPPALPTPPAPVGIGLLVAAYNAADVPQLCFQAPRCPLPPVPSRPRPRAAAAPALGPCSAGCKGVQGTHGPGRVNSSAGTPQPAEPAAGAAGSVVLPSPACTAPALLPPAPGISLPSKLPGETTSPYSP